MSDQRRCPGCGRIVLFDDDTLSVAHEDPMCPAFAEIMAGAVEKGEAVCDGRVLRTVNEKDLN